MSKALGIWVLFRMNVEMRVLNNYLLNVTFYSDRDLFYLTTDGYADQLGPKGKLLTKRFRHLLGEMFRKPTAEQHRLLNANLLRWKVAEPQTDDILVFGLRL
jgi:serine phosphatase RsbU (regulator of sigma subunit)